MPHLNFDVLRGCVSARPTGGARLMGARAESTNTTQTAKNLVCARVWGASAEAADAQLADKHGALCGAAATCPLMATLEAWAKATPPITLESDKALAAKR
jgi:hypothetical protein